MHARRRRLAVRLLIRRRVNAESYAAPVPSLLTVDPDPFAWPDGWDGWSADVDRCAPLVDMLHALTGDDVDELADLLRVA